jgi:hypothetical protein
MSAARAMLAIGGAVLLMGAARDSDEAVLAKQLAGRVPGKPVDCIDAQFADGPMVINHRTILYRVGATVYRNDLPSECRPLTETSTVIAELYSNQICYHDRFRTREPGETIPSQFCFFGRFTPYTKPKR